MLAQIQSNTNKAYVALQSYITSPTQLALPGVVRTDRPQLTRNQIADRYLKSVAGNPDIDINKARTGEQAGMPKMVQQQEPRISRSLLARNMACEKNLTVSDYLLARSNEVNYKFIGGTANETCLFTVPEFATSKNFVISSSSYEGYPKNTNDFGELFGDAFPCMEFVCMKPEDILRLVITIIDDSLQRNIATRVYLT